MEHQTKQARVPDMSKLVTESKLQANQQTWNYHKGYVKGALNYQRTKGKDDISRRHAAQLAIFNFS